MSTQTCWLLAAVLLFVTVGALVSRDPGESVRPDDDQRVLAHVPERTGELDLLQRAQRTSPGDLALSLRLARAHIAAARKDGDPRPLGHAEAVLAPFLQGGASDVEVLVLRATIRQARHEFEAALTDLDAVLDRQPRHAQALLTRATVLTVLGRHAEARASCEALFGLVPPAWQVACAAPIAAVSGGADSAREALDGALHSALDAEERAWLHSLRGELAFWQDDFATSERHLKAALALDDGDRYTRALYADLLLDQGRAGEALHLTEQRLSDDALLLRAALSAKAQGSASAIALIERTREGFRASRRRGDRVHQREEARLLLAMGQPDRALTLALEGFAVQREPWDVRLVLEAARAAERPDLARPALAFLEQTHFDAPRLLRLSRELRSGR